MSELRPSAGSIARTAAAYLAMLAAAVALFSWIQHAGGRLTAPPPTHAEGVFGSGRDPAHVNHLLHVLLALVVIVVAARTVGHVFRWIGQPPVIGEVCAGIMLGPSLLGSIWPEVTAFVLPPEVGPFLQIQAQVGVILFMFLVGLELDTRYLRQGTHTTIAISHASIVVPFVLGAVLALWLYPILSTSDVPFTIFALFMGVAMSITAFPVLARILTDRGMQRSRLGVVAITCAAVDDVTAWCLLAFVVGVVQARVSGALTTIGTAAVFIGTMVFLARPLLVSVAARVERAGRLSQGVVAVVVVALLLSALATESIGIHAIFGAFLLGALIPHDTLLARELRQRFEDIAVVLFLPAFFAYTGMRTQIGLVNTVEEWLLCALINAVACAGKFGGSAVAARLTGLGRRDAAALGILMNTRGLIQLVVLDLGLDLGVIGPRLFAMLVIMAVVTTMMTSPLLALLARRPDGVAGQPRPAGHRAREPSCGGATWPGADTVAIPARDSADAAPRIGAGESRSADADGRGVADDASGDGPTAAGRSGRL